MLHKIAVGFGLTAGALVAVLLTTALDHGGDTIAPRFRSLLNAALIISAVCAVLTEQGHRTRRATDQLRDQVTAAVHDEIHDAVADAYRTGAIMTAGTTPVLRSVARD